MRGAKASMRQPLLIPTNKARFQYLVVMAIPLHTNTTITALLIASLLHISIYLDAH